MTPAEGAAYDLAFDAISYAHGACDRKELEQGAATFSLELLREAAKKDPDRNFQPAILVLECFLAGVKGQG